METLQELCLCNLQYFLNPAKRPKNMTINYQSDDINTHSPHRILLVDDDPHIAALLREYLQSEGYEVLVANDSQQMFEQLGRFSADLVILDLMLGQENALHYARDLCERFDLGVVILTSRRDLSDRVVGLEMGADDYITKPFEVREVLARVRSVLRRTAIRQNNSRATQQPPSIACFAGWQLDMMNYMLVAPEGTEVPITSHEFLSLCAFVQNAPKVLSRDQLMDHLYPSQTLSPFDRRIDVLVLKLRRKLRDPAGRPRLIKTVRGAGYVLTAEISYREKLSLSKLSSAVQADERSDLHPR